jgi:WhiB family transcriptional regulator, redox-sensing transcriptional regulator
MTDELRDVMNGRPSWHTLAACRGIDPDLFFPDRGDPTQHAKAVCGGCAVRPECLEFSLVNSERFGIWGGLSERERRALRRQRRLAS